jgi:hypothetical protein
MYKNPVYGFEKSYLETIKKEIEKYAETIYFDAFDNLIVSPENINDDTILIGIEASENALLINEILDNGLVEFSPYKELDKNIIYQKAFISNKKGLIFGDEKNYKIDFGYTSKKPVSKFLKKGDTLYIEPTLDNFGEAIYTNMKCFLLKDIMIDLIKTNKNKNIVFAFIREGKKGAYALGKTLKTNRAYFVCLAEEVPVSLIRKEGEYISSMKIDKTEISVLKKEESLASAYYLAGGSCNSTGVALKYQDMKNGIFKVLKSDIKKLLEILDSSMSGDI